MISTRTLLIHSWSLILADICEFSCFPIVPKIACHHLGLPIIRPPKPITLLGGLTFFGGAGNNYSMHVSTLFAEDRRLSLYICTN